MHGSLSSSIAVYPGSFDPITLGHLDLIRRLAGFYDQLIVLVASSVNKQAMFSPTERKALIEACLQDLPTVRVDTFDGLTVDYARQAGAGIVLRGLRAVADFEYEFAMANMNRRLAPEVETMIVFTRPEFSFVSSRNVKEVAIHGGALDDLVHPRIARALRERVIELKKKGVL